MITNPIIMDSGGRMLERRTDLLRVEHGGSTGVENVGSVRDGIATAADSASGFGSAGQLNKGIVGRILTPEWQGKIDLSQGIQIADQAMEAIEERLKQAKSDLTKIHKMFPPYPHGSEERADFLKSYKSLRMQIDKLTIPPENDISAQILGGKPVGDQVKSEVGQFPVHSGPEGLELIDIGKPIEDLSDDELPVLIADLGRASGVLYERRASLEESAGKIFNQKDGTEVEFINLSIEVKEKFATVDTSIVRSETGVHQELPFLG